MRFKISSLFLLCLIVVTLLVPSSHAFGAGNIASIAKIEGHNWRHGDIEDTLKGLAHLRGYKWNSMNIKRVYFGNWLRDYSQAVDVGTLKGVPADTIRLLLWVLAFMTFGYATAEFEVTPERLGCYRPEEHIDNPKGYADGVDARQYDSRLRGPVSTEELAIDSDTGMKNYIANEHGHWATSIGYVKYSLTRAIHFGRVYKHGGGGSSGKEADLFEAFRCLGQGLHCLEDFGAHSNYVELALIELGHDNVFPHVGTATKINLRGKHVYPLVTGTFGGVDFLHSVIGEASDHVTQSEVDEMDKALSDASGPALRGDPGATRQANDLIALLDKVPGSTGGLIQQARDLQRDSQAQAERNATGDETTRAGFSPFGAASAQSSAQNIDPKVIIAKIYPIMVFRDNVVRTISSIVSHIPGLESLIEKISEKVTLFVMSLLSPYILPVIRLASAQLKTGSSAVINSSANHQYEVWSDPSCTDPTHSMLSKDHFSNILNEPAGQVASCVLQYVVPKVVEAWEKPDVPIERVLDDAVGHVFHHPAIRGNGGIQAKMFDVVHRWVDTLPSRGANLNQVLSSDSVKSGGNHKGGASHTHGGGGSGIPAHASQSSGMSPSGFPTFQNIQSSIPGVHNFQYNLPNLSAFRSIDANATAHQSTQDFESYSAPPGSPPQHHQQNPQQYNYNSSNQHNDYYNPAPPGDQGQYPPFPAGPRPNDPDAYSTAYQQGYEVDEQAPIGGPAEYGGGGFGKYGQEAENQGYTPQGQQRYGEQYGGRQGYQPGQAQYGNSQDWDQRW